MRLIRGLQRWRETGPCVVSIGNFDGVHRGHQAMLQQLNTIAKEHNLPSCVISFEPTPQEFFSPDQSPARLNGFRDRVQSIAAEQCDNLLLLTFDEAQSRQSAEDFVKKVLVETIKVRHVQVGDDFRFGYQRAGDINLLHKLGQEHGFTASAHDTFSIDGKRVSSTLVRKHLGAGKLSEAADLLGHPYRITGRVIHGEKVGRQLGFPTANITLRQHRPPLRGVFAVVAHDKTSGQSYPGVANLGERPTVGGRKLLLEVHMLKHDIDVYGHHIQVDFMEFVRSEQKFDSLDALKEAISNDSDTALAQLKGNPQLTYLFNRIH